MKSRWEGIASAGDETLPRRDWIRADDDGRVSLADVIATADRLAETRRERTAEKFLSGAAN